MSAHCPKCGDYTEEDDARLCGRCAMSNANEAGPTPGPWRVAEHSIGILDVMGSPTGVCRVFTDTNQHGRPVASEARANARLIAAAPDLLAACEAMVAAMHPNGVLVHSGTVNALRVMNDAHKAARSAIAKATGK